jgi:tellurite resistance protein TehA-like permease
MASQNCYCTISLICDTMWSVTTVMSVTVALQIAGLELRQCRDNAYDVSSHTFDLMNETWLLPIVPSSSAAAEAGLVGHP